MGWTGICRRPCPRAWRAPQGRVQHAFSHGGPRATREAAYSRCLLFAEGMSEAESEWTPWWRLWPRGGAGSGPRCGGATRSSAVSGVRPPWGERLGRPVQCDRSEHRGLRGAGPAAGTLARPAPQSDACSPWRVCGCARASVGLRVCVPLGPGVFTPQSCVHVSCPPCARARRVDCVCLHLMCNSVCVCVCVCHCHPRASSAKTRGFHTHLNNTWACTSLPACGHLPLLP